MKKFLLLLLAIVTTALSFYGQEITLDDATRAALTRLQRINAETAYSIESVTAHPNDQEVLFYVFDLLPVGYIVVTSVQTLPPVMAYSLTDGFGENHAGNPLLDLLYTDIRLRLLHADKLSAEARNKIKSEWEWCLQPDSPNPKRDFIQWPPEGTTATGGWIETNYTQSYPYDQFCPLDPVTNGRSYVGCPATAMAQIINYYQTVNNTLLGDDDDYYHSYAGRRYWIDDDYASHDFLSFDSLNTYLTTIGQNFENNLPISNQEAAALSFACGITAHQVYSSEGSGTFGVDQAMESMQRFGFTESVLLMDGDTTLFDTLMQNMKDARPALLAMVNATSTSGHNVVADGYNTDDFYHVNFGWGGTYNGWYQLPQDFPYGLTVVEGVVANIAYPKVNTTIADNSVRNQLDIFPNPANDRVTIRFEQALTNPVTVSLFDASGKVVLIKRQADLDADHSSLTLELKKEDCMLQLGWYVVWVKSGTARYSGRVFVQ